MSSWLQCDLFEALDQGKLLHACGMLQKTLSSELEYAINTWSRNGTMSGLALGAGPTHQAQPLLKHWQDPKSSHGSE